MVTRFVILAGNVIDGIQVFGPFDTAEEANEYGDGLFHNSGWEWIVATMQGVK